MVLGALGTTPIRLAAFLSLLDIALSVETIQKSGLLGSAKIVREALDINDDSGVPRLQVAACP